MSDKNNGIPITASRFDQEDDDFATNGFGNCLTRDGQGRPTADINWNGQRLTTLADPGGTQDAANVRSVQQSLIWGGTSTGSANAQVVALTPILFSGDPPSGMTVRFLPGFTNTGSTTLQLGGGPAHVMHQNGVPLTGGELAAGIVAQATYDGGFWQLARI